MIKRSHIRQFLAVVDAGSFTQAALRLRVTQPTLSTGVAELERLLSTILFLRERRQLRLTEAGGRFLPIARELERGFRAADAFGAGPHHDWPELKLGVIRSVAGDYLQSLIQLLAAQFEIELIEGTDNEVRAALNSGRAHMILTLLRDGEKGPHILPLLDEPYVMLLPKDHAMAGQAELIAEELAAEIMIARRSCEMLDATSRFFSQRGVRPRFSLRSASDERCVHMVVAGLGITTAPLSFLSLAPDQLVARPVREYDFHRRIGLMADPSWSDHGHAQAVLGNIAAQVRQIWHGQQQNI